MNKVDQIILQAKKEGRTALLEPEAKAVCVAYGIPVTKFYVAKNEDEAANFAAKIGFPVVLKIVSPEIIHKTEAGGVKVNLKTPQEVKAACNTILANVKKYNPQATIAGVLVQEMAPPSTEVIVGSVKDATFGQTVMFGLGGIFVEMLKDVTFRVAPLTKQDATSMVTELKAYSLLKGYRSSPPVDIDAIVDTILRVSKLVMDHPEIKELDLNPIMVYETGAKTVDARIILEPSL
ncbi:MAG: acetate--CoA ligase family protein [Candidatus Bathyarchaeia archaeon]